MANLGFKLRQPDFRVKPFNDTMPLCISQVESGKHDGLSKRKLFFVNVWGNMVCSDSIEWTWLWVEKKVMGSESKKCILGPDAERILC